MLIYDKFIRTSKRSISEYQNDLLIDDFMEAAIGRILTNQLNELLSDVIWAPRGGGALMWNP